MDDFTEFWILANTVKNASDTASGYGLAINDVKIAQNAAAINNQQLATNKYGNTHCTFDGLFWECRASNGAIANSNVMLNNSNAQYPYNVVKNVGAAKSFKLVSPVTAYVATSGTIEIWGR